jgi:hypothetical protein
MSEAVTAMDTYSYHADVQEEKLQRTVIALQDVVSVCHQHQAELGEAIHAKEELEKQVMLQQANLQEALSLLKDLVPKQEQNITLDALNTYRVRTFLSVLTDTPWHLKALPSFAPMSTSLVCAYIASTKAMQPCSHMRYP